MKLLLPLFFSSAQLLTNTSSFNKQAQVTIKNPNNSFSFTEKPNYQKTITFLNDLKPDANIDLAPIGWTHNPKLLRNFFQKHFIFKISDKFLNYLNDGLDMKISFDIEIQRQYQTDQIAKKEFKKVICNFESQEIFNCGNQKEYLGVVCTLDPLAIGRGNFKAFHDFYTKWNCAYDKTNQLLNIFEDSIFEKIPATSWEHTHLAGPHIRQAVYKINQVEYKFQIPKRLTDQIKKHKLVNNNFENLYQLEKMVVEYEKTVKSKITRSHNSNQFQNLFDKWKINDFSRLEFSKFKWNDETEITIEIPIKEKYQAQLKSVFFTIPITQKINIEHLIEPNFLTITKDELDNVKDSIPKLALWLNTALNYQIKDNQLIITVKKNFSKKFYGVKKIKLEIIDNNQNNQANNAINNYSSLEPNPYKKPRTDNKINNQDQKVTTNPYLYMSISIFLIILIACLYGFSRPKKR
ncbi:hypothetical protein [Mycoplasma putrefaciens]|uniref:Uncharacterized protein n=1 Tax=Mycoplasma putrefaciens Mput9231 TaxID=1292033 RepID=M9WHU5_9MOLU|nr:hypothetical protein [Mycoplasma putrefaciens]AGJ90934.1 Hypothetical protein, predicted transmembrane protein [Mycoplasma putrefaciens Mput9231]